MTTIGRVIHQLRIYEVDPTLVEQFDERFKTHAKRIMERHGFQIESMWYAREDGSVQFIYILVWQDAEQMRTQWEAFMADPEWEAVKQRSRETTGEPVTSKVADKVLTDTY